MTTAWIIVAAALAAGAAKEDASPPPGGAAQAASPHAPRSSRELRAAISAALRREATTTGHQHDSAVRELTTVFNELKADEQLPEAERRQRLGQLRHRLVAAADKLARDAAAEPAAAESQRPRNPGALRMAQRGAAPGRPRGNAAVGRAAPAGAAGGTAAANGAQELIDLIQNTIAPETWDVRGGPGSIMYFEPKQVLVIRQTGEVHGKFQDLVRQLRR